MKKIETVEKRLEAQGIDPVLSIVNLLKHGEMTDLERAEGWLALLGYCEPKIGLENDSDY